MNTTFYAQGDFVHSLCFFRYNLMVQQFALDSFIVRVCFMVWSEEAQRNEMWLNILRPFCTGNLSNQHVLNRHTKFIDCCRASTGTGNLPVPTQRHAYIINGIKEMRNVVLHCIEQNGNAWRINDVDYNSNATKWKFAYWSSQLRTPRTTNL